MERADRLHGLAWESPNIQRDATGVLAGRQSPRPPVEQKNTDSAFQEPVGTPVGRFTLLS